MFRVFSKVFPLWPDQVSALCELWNLCLVHRLRVFFIHQASKSLSLQLCNLDKASRVCLGRFLELLLHAAPSLLFNTLPHKFSHLSILYLWSLFPLLICFALFGLHFLLPSFGKCPRQRTLVNVEFTSCVSFLSRMKVVWCPVPVISYCKCFI